MTLSASSQRTMHPFGGTPICPRCSKSVYLAEQVMGPGRKLYHKPCLACTICNKRLDSFTLLEHDQQPFCKSCHLKNFGTRDLRHANLPYAQPPIDDAAQSSSPISPTSPTRGAFPPQALLRPLSTGGGGPNTSYHNSPLPRLKPNRSLATSPTSPSFPRGTSPTSSTFHSVGNVSAPDGDSNPKTDLPSMNDASTPEEEAEVHDSLMLDRNGADSIPEEDEGQDGETRDVLEGPYSNSQYPSNTGRPGIGTIPRTIPLYLNGGGSVRTPYRHHTSRSVGSMPSGSSPTTAASTSSKEAEDTEDNPSESFSGLGSPVGWISSPGSRSFGSVGPLTQSATGTRYGIALTGGSVSVHNTGTGGSPRKWGGSTPVCPRCMKSVYFAEQVKAVGKTFHKNCLRCIECNSSLDSSRLRDHDGDPFCVRCYGKLHGPQGSGYALLGKAGG